MGHRFRAGSKSVIGRWIFRGGLHRRLFRNAAIVVTFHRVNNSGVGDGLTCDVETFKRYCSFFIQYFDVVSLRDLVEKLEKGTPLDHELAITFDDGYEDNYECAAPVLKAMGLPATFFVASKYIGTHVIAWWDRHLAARQSWMTWDQVQWLGREGFEIGAHTRTHVNLGEVTETEVWEEILGSRLDLEEKLSTRIDLFAYPYGKEKDISEEARETIKAAGFRCCCSCFGGVNVIGTDPYHLRRIPISSWYASPDHFACELAFRRV